MRLAPSLRGALATKQSRVFPRKDSGLLRYARNDGVEAVALPEFVLASAQSVWRMPAKYSAIVPAAPMDLTAAIRFNGANRVSRRQ